MVGGEEMKELTTKQEKFVFEFLRTGNATQAYLKVYDGKNKSSAGVFGCRLLRNDKVKAEIEKLREELRQNYQFELADYVRQLLKIVGADIGDYVKFGRREEEFVINKKGDKITKTVNFVDLSESDAVDTSIIEEIKQIKGDVTIRLIDKTFALKELARLFGFGSELNETELPSIFVDNVSVENES